MPQQRSTTRTVLVVLACVVVLGLWWWAGRDDGSSPPAADRGSTAATSNRTSDGTASGLPTVSVADLPPEARRTLALIEAGGPFPYERDGVVFQNREGLLPRKERGYYHEYTVPTPGENDRGARRIITGDGGERYWTADHYASFAVITEEP